MSIVEATMSALREAARYVYASAYPTYPVNIPYVPSVYYLVEVANERKLRCLDEYTFSMYYRGSAVVLGRYYTMADCQRDLAGASEYREVRFRTDAEGVKGLTHVLAKGDSFDITITVEALLSYLDISIGTFMPLVLRDLYARLEDVVRQLRESFPNATIGLSYDYRLELSGIRITFYVTASGTADPVVPVKLIVVAIIAGFMAAGAIAYFSYVAVKEVSGTLRVRYAKEVYDSYYGAYRQYLESLDRYYDTVKEVTQTPVQPPPSPPDQGGQPPSPQPSQQQQQPLPLPSPPQPPSPSALTGVGEGGGGGGGGVDWMGMLSSLPSMLVFVFLVVVFIEVVRALRR